MVKKQLVCTTGHLSENAQKAGRSLEFKRSPEGRYRFRNHNSAEGIDSVGQGTVCNGEEGEIRYNYYMTIPHPCSFGKQSSMTT